MTSSDNTHPTLLEHLPTEIFLQIFTFFSLREVVKAFFGLNSYIDSLIRLVRDASHAVKYTDVDGINLLQSFPSQIGRLVIINAKQADFTSLINLRSLTLKYGTPARFDIIRPLHFPLLEILGVTGPNKTVTNSDETINKLLQVLLSNGFPRLRRCMMFNIGLVSFSDTWTGSPTLRTLNLQLKSHLDCEQLRSICPRLHQLTTNRFPFFHTSTVPDFVGTKRILHEFEKLEHLESENKIIIDANPLAPFISQKVPPRFNNTTITGSLNTVNMYNFQARILPQSEPFCRASFLIEIRLAPEYPFKLPDIFFLDPIYHPSVNELGRYCSTFGIYHDQPYQPTTTLVEIVETLIHIIDSKPNPEYAINSQCLDEYCNDYPRFYKKALDLTLSYGRPRL